MKSTIIHGLGDVIRLRILYYDAQHTLYKTAGDNTDWTTNQGWDQANTLNASQGPKK
jgi:hypothetical protein